MILECRTLDGRRGHEAGRALLSELYTRETGEPLPEIHITEAGKPYFPHSPWHFSISHTKGHAFCALSRNPVGIDAEELNREVRLIIAPRVLSAMEMEQFEAAPDQRKALLTFWVLKEASAKFTGEGIRSFPRHTSFSLDDPRVTERDSCLLAVIE